MKQINIRKKQKIKKINQKKINKKTKKKGKENPKRGIFMTEIHTAPMRDTVTAPSSLSTNGYTNSWKSSNADPSSYREKELLCSSLSYCKNSVNSTNSDSLFIDFTIKSVLLSKKPSVEIPEYMGNILPNIRQLL